MMPAASVMLVSHDKNWWEPNFHRHIHLIYLAARDAIRRLKSAGCTHPCLVLSPTLKKGEAYERATEVALLGALFGCYSPLMNREFSGEKVAEPIEEIAFIPLEGTRDNDIIINEVLAMESGRRAARDLCGMASEEYAFSTKRDRNA